MKNNSNRKFPGGSFTLVLLAVLLILGMFYVFEKSYSKGVVLGTVNQVAGETLSSPSPTPFLFEEMTIPYLRAREYESKLGELESYSNNGSFRSNLTSYDSDGFKVNGLLTQPSGEKPEKGWPAIVFIHGYIPPTLYKTTEKYEDYVNYLASRGYVVFKIDLRGHGSSEGEPEGAYYSSGYIIDALNAHSALQNSGFVNPEKIGIWGHSMAGNVTLRALAAKPEIPAVSIWGGAVYTYLDMTELGIQDGSYRPPVDQTQRLRKRQLLRETYGDAKDGNPFWKLVAATNYLSDIKGAIQLNHAVDDDVVSIEYSRGLNKLLESTSIPHELNEYSGGGHNITNPSFTNAMQDTVEFFNRYLKSL